MKTIQQIQQSHQIPPTVAQQIFTIGSGIAGGLAGMYLARQLVGVKNVPKEKVISATFISALFTFGAAVFLARALEKEAIGRRR